MNITMAMSDAAVAEELYSRLESYRQTRGMTQEALAEKLGISRPTYSRIQKGTCSLTVFLGVLRELNLLEGLNSLIPAPSLRPSEIVKRRTGLSRSLHSSGVAKRNINTSGEDSWRKISSGMSVREMLANRKK
ncbi:helix-turn-helix transcriptional regulator [Scandinavium goeteborgense]|uniref:helix-turn-helix transcriptional regulator n=2 Tax=Enterobacteriaceae TaxID=543 RepID=UPI0037F53E5F